MEGESPQHQLKGLGGGAVADLEICKGGFGLDIHNAPPKVVRRAAKWRSVRAKRGKFFTCSF